MSIPQDTQVNETHYPELQIILPAPANNCKYDSSQDRQGQVPLLALVPPPTSFDLISPAICRGRDHLLTLDGEYFLDVDNEKPKLEDTTSSFIFEYQHINMSNCSYIPVDQLSVMKCKLITVSDIFF